MPSNEDYSNARGEAVRYHYLRPPDKTYTTSPGIARNVIGVGIGPRIKDGKPHDEQCIRFYVEKKIRPLDAIDETFRIPKKLGQVPTDVIETGRFVSFQQEAGPGAKIGIDYDAPNVDPTLAGTLGAVVKVGDTWYALGASHVMAVNGRVPVGTRIMFRPPDQFIDDPSKYLFARLAVYKQLCQSGVNTVDCALAAVENPDLLTGEFPDYIVKFADPIDPQLKMKVARAGQSGQAYGVIEDISKRLRIDFRFGTFDFDQMVLIKGQDGPFANPGDSGALVVDPETKRATAIIVGGSNEYTIACRLGTALSELVGALPKEYQAGGKFALVLNKLQPDGGVSIQDQKQKIASNLKGLFARIAPNA